MSEIFYAIGDIHGDLDQLREAHEKIRADIRKHGFVNYKVVHVGDLVDRREDSRGVIEFLIQGIAQGEPWVVLKGNHDRLFTMFLDNPSQKDPVLRSDYTWLHPRMGGQDTLASYGVETPHRIDLDVLCREALAAVPQSHREFLENLPLSYEIESYIFVHAGIRPGVPLDQQVENDLIWIRDPFLDFEGPHPKVIIHGHTVVDEVIDHGNRINIDTGAAYGGPLSTIVIEKRGVWLLEKEGRASIPKSTLGSGTNTQ